MPSITRSPTGQDLVCLVCRKQAQDIDHVVNRGMGGSKARDVPENKVPLCRECHDLKTVGRIETWIDKGGWEEYWYHWKRKGAEIWIHVPVEVSQRYKCLVLSDGAEAVARTPASSPDPSAPSPSAGEKEEGDETTLDGLRDVAGPRDVDAGSNPKSLPVLTHEQRVAIAQEIKDAEWNRQWIAGDTGNAWIAELGEEAEQYLSDFGYVHESLANILRVCAAIPPPYRCKELRFSHHVVVYQLNHEDIEMWLETAQQEQWTVKQLREAVHGVKTRIKRWSIQELRTFAAENHYLQSTNVLRLLDALEAAR